MYILKNAWTSITRNKGRNILISIIIVTIAIAVTISLSIYNSASKLITSYEESNELRATISLNRENFMKDFHPEEENMDELKENFQNMPSLSVSQIDSYGDSKYVSRYYYTSKINIDSNLEKATSEEETDSKMPKRPREENFALTGYSSNEAMEEFLQGNYTISSGVISSEDNTCLINEELANLNSINLGDEITIINPNDENLTYQLKVSGIFKDNLKTEDNKMDLFSKSVNNIITTTTVSQKIIADDESLKTEINPTYYLKSSNDLEAFSQEVTDKGLSENYMVSASENDVEEALRGVNNLKTFALSFLIIALIIGVVILLVINMINIRERKYEIGVLRTIGMKKSLVITKFILELFIVAIFSLSIGLGIGAVCSVPTANHLLKAEIDNSEEKMNNAAMNFDNHHPEGRDFKIAGVANIKKVDTINAIVDGKVIIELLGIGILLTFVSSSCAIIAITRFSPLEILKERSS